MLKAIYGNTQQIYISTLYIKFHQVMHYIHFNIPIYKKQEKLIHEFILYTRNPHEMESKYCIMGSINQNKRMEMEHIHYISCFHTNILHIKFSWIQAMKNIKITYQVMGTQHITQNIIHENL